MPGYQSAEKPSQSPRACGACRVCCQIFPLPILGKAENELCRFATANGCGVYGKGQPEVCRQYSCYWLDHEETPETWRPDCISVVATEGGLVRVAGQELPVLVLNEVEEGACRASGGQALVDDLVAAGHVLMVVHGSQMRIVFDRARYAAITETKIETAFRYERSQDAEELRRLGAVDEDYRPLSWTEADEK